MKKFDWLTFLGVPKELQDIANSDPEFMEITKADGLPDQERFFKRLGELKKQHGIKYPKRPVWVRDSPTGPICVKLLTPFEHYQHYQQAGFGVPKGYQPETLFGDD